MTDKLGVIETAKRKYPICFNLNVMEEIQDKYGSMSKWGEIVTNNDGGEPKIKELKEGLMAMINEAIEMQNEDNNTNDPIVTAKQVGRIITEVGFNKIIEIIMSTSKESTETPNDGKNE